MEVMAKEEEKALTQTAQVKLVELEAMVEKVGMVVTAEMREKR